MSDPEAIASFIAKWHARWPEWSIAEVFVPPVQREAALAWMTLVQEITDAAWGGSDPRPGEAKLGWWIEELHGWSRGLRRHPLGQVLQKRAAPWAQLTAALPSLRDSRERPLDAAGAAAQLRPVADAVAAVELALFGEATPQAPEVIGWNLLQLRLAHHRDEAVPLHVLAQAGAEGAAAEWTRQLAAHASVRGAARPRRVLAALARTRLRRGDARQPVPALPALWAAWRAAQG